MTARTKASSPDSTLLVGYGRLGSTLGIALAERGWPLAAVAGRRPEAAEVLGRRLGSAIAAVDLQSPGGVYPVVLIAVSDDAIGAVADMLARAGVVDERSTVLHCSGVHGSGVLAPAAGRGAATGSLHPLQTFPDPESGVRALPGTHWFFEGEPRALQTARRIVQLLEGVLHEVAPGDKALYHASASIACNLLTALVDVSLEVGEAGGIERRELLEALYPLVRAAVDNAREHGTAAALTGPISRGDSDTVALHLKAIGHMQEAAAAYRVLGRRSVALALRAGKIDDETAATILRVLASQEH